VDRAEIEPVGGHIGGRVEQHVIAVRLRERHPAERMLHAGEIALRRKGEQAAPGAQRRLYGVRRDAQLGHVERDVRGRQPACPGVLPDPVDRVVVVGREDEAGAGLERIGLGDEPAGAGGVRGEDDGVLLRGGVEVRQDRGPGAIDERGGRARGGVLRVRIAEYPVPQPGGVRRELRAGRQPGAGVVEVHVSARVEVGVLPVAQFIQPAGTGVRRVGGQERRAGHAIPATI
jgi:hypothetical protein